MRLRVVSMGERRKKGGGLGWKVASQVDSDFGSVNGVWIRG